MAKPEENAKDIKEIIKEQSAQKLEYSVALAKIITLNETIIEKLDKSEIADTEIIKRVSRLEQSRMSFKKALQVVSLITGIAVALMTLGVVI